MAALSFRWRKPEPPIKMRWRGVDGATFQGVDDGEINPRRLAAIVGPPGQDGQNQASYDPGDITLSFDNALI